MKRFIKNIIRDDFNFPNEKRSQYEVDINHEVNNNEPTGSISSSNLSVTSSQITFDVDYTYNRNGSEPFQIISGGTYTFMTLHLLAPDQDYLKPWRLIYQGTTTGTTANLSLSGTLNLTVNPSDLGLTEFISGDYVLEARFIGKRTISVVREVLSGSLPSPTPTPTPSPTVPVYTGTCSGMTVDVYYEDNPGDACSEFIKTGHILASDTGDIDNATVLFSGIDACTTYNRASAGYYHQSGSTIVRYWDGVDTFTNQDCVTITPTPTPTPTAVPVAYYQECYRCVDDTSNWFIGPFYDPFTEINPGTPIWGAVECEDEHAYTVIGIPVTSIGTGALLGGWSFSEYPPCYGCDNQPINP